MSKPSHIHPLCDVTVVTTFAFSDVTVVTTCAFFSGELADEAFRDLLRKYGRPTDLKAALRE
jgi:hypothetical protein